MFVIELATQQKQGFIEFPGNFNGKPATPLVIPFSALQKTPAQNKSQPDLKSYPKWFVPKWILLKLPLLKITHIDFQFSCGGLKGF